MAPQQQLADSVFDAKLPWPKGIESWCVVVGPRPPYPYHGLNLPRTALQVPHFFSPSYTARESDHELTRKWAPRPDFRPKQNQDPWYSCQNQGQPS